MAAIVPGLCVVPSLFFEEINRADWVVMPIPSLNLALDVAHPHSM